MPRWAYVIEDDRCRSCCVRNGKHDNGNEYSSEERIRVDGAGRLSAGSASAAGSDASGYCRVAQELRDPFARGPASCRGGRLRRAHRSTDHGCRRGRAQGRQSSRMSSSRTMTRAFTRGTSRKGSSAGRPSSRARRWCAGIDDLAGARLASTRRIRAAVLNRDEHLPGARPAELLRTEPAEVAATFQQWQRS